MLETALRLTIPAQISSQLTKSELADLVKSYGIVEQALTDFNEGLLTWTEYLELLETHQVNIDSYLETVDHNLRIIGVS